MPILCLDKFILAEVVFFFHWLGAFETDCKSPEAFSAGPVVSHPWEYLPPTPTAFFQQVVGTSHLHGSPHKCTVWPHGQDLWVTPSRVTAGGASDQPGITLSAQSGEERRLSGIRQDRLVTNFKALSLPLLLVLSLVVRCTISSVLHQVMVPTTGMELNYNSPNALFGLKMEQPTAIALRFSLSKKEIRLAFLQLHEIGVLTANDVFPKCTHYGGKYWSNLDAASSCGYIQQLHNNQVFGR